MVAKEGKTWLDLRTNR